jgi:hypothetical protein
VSWRLLAFASAHRAPLRLGTLARRQRSAKTTEKKKISTRANVRYPCPCLHNPTISDWQLESRPLPFSHPTIPHPNTHRPECIIPGVIKTSHFPPSSHSLSPYFLSSSSLPRLPFPPSYTVTLSISSFFLITLSISSSFLTNILHRGSDKMVQSAILGFPRMGVNRDLKKATEACKCPRRLSCLPPLRLSATNSLGIIRLGRQALTI